MHPLITPEHLHAGMAIWQSHRRWPTDFHNSLYYPGRCDDNEEARARDHTSKVTLGEEIVATK